MLLYCLIASLSFDCLYATDRHGELDFFTSLSPAENTYSDRDQLAFLETIDTMVLGRKTYELFVDFWPTATTDKEVIADKLNSLDKIVFFDSLKEAPWGKWPEARLITGDAAAAIRELKMQPGKNMVLWGSISLAQSLMQQNMVDEYHLQLCPVVNSGGRLLFPADFVLEKLVLTEVRHYNTGTVFLNCRSPGKLG